MKDAYPDIVGGDYGNIKVVNNRAYFHVNEGGSDELWSTDGTEAGTTHLPQITTNIPNGAAPATFHWMIPIGSKLIMDRNGPEGKELWVTDFNLTAPLPLTLLDIKGQLSGNDGLLTWKTSSEQNTLNFEIERSFDGRNFSKTGTVLAAGNSSIEKQYIFTDRNIVSLDRSVVYYRLKMNDIDRKFTYSKIIAININNDGAVVMLYPNPVKENATLMISVSKQEKLSYTIVDAQGKMVQKSSISLNKGSNTISIETGHLPAGVYIISFEEQGRVRFIKQ